MDKKVISADGSYTYFSHLFNECYHSLKDGAYTETLHKYIYPPLLFGNFHNQPLKILDICFGLGYNSFLTAQIYHQYPNSIKIIAPEIDQGVLKKIPTLSHFSITDEQIAILAQQKPLWLTKNICLQVIFEDALKVIPNLKNIDIIYLDAFSQKSTPQFWSKEFFSTLYKILQNQGMIMSYCTHSQVYQNALSVGLKVYKYTNKFCRKSSIFTKELVLDSDNLLEIT